MQRKCHVYLPLADDASKPREGDNLPKVNGRAKERRKIMDAKFHLRQLSLRLVFLFLLCPSLCITDKHVQIHVHTLRRAL